MLGERGRREMANKRSGPSMGLFNRLLVILVMALTTYMLIHLGYWALGREHPRAETLYVPPVERGPIECLVLLPPEVSREPTYVIGRGEECD